MSGSNQTSLVDIPPPKTFSWSSNRTSIKIRSISYKKTRGDKTLDQIKHEKIRHLSMEWIPDDISKRILLFMVILSVIYSRGDMVV